MWLVLLLCGLTSIYAQTDCTVEGSVRLEGPFSDLAGRVEICYNGVWGTICGESETIPWSEKNAQVVCKQLGYSGALNSILQHTLPFLSRVFDPVPVHYRGVSCLGNELTLRDCPGIAEVGPSDNCPHDNDVAITCRSTTENTAGVGDVRLAGDPINGHGAVQLFDESFGWIGVCYDSTWGDDEANVVCRQLGYESGTARSYSIASLIRTAYSFSCDPNIDETINDCSYASQIGCFSFQRGGVECSSSSLPEGSIRLAGSGLAHLGRVEILYNGRWGTICNTFWDNADGEVACQQLGLGNDVVNTFTFDLPSYSDPSNVNPSWLTTITCSVNDQKLSECDHGNPIGYTNCLGGDAELECSVPEEVPGGLSGGAIAGIVIAVIVFVTIVLLLIFQKDIKRRWNERHRSEWWRRFTCPCRCISELYQRIRRNRTNRRSRPTVTPATTTTVPPSATTTVPTPIAQTQTVSEPETREAAAAEPTTTTIEPDEPSQNQQETKFTKVPPPSYQTASSFPPPDPSYPPPPMDQPPPYPGPANPYPPAPYPSFQGYPPPTDIPYPQTNFAYPPPTNFAYPPTLDPAYPPPTVPDLPSTAPDTT